MHPSLYLALFKNGTRTSQGTPLDHFPQSSKCIQTFSEWSSLIINKCILVPQLKLNIHAFSGYTEMHICLANIIA